MTMTSKYLPNGEHGDRTILAKQLLDILMYIVRLRYLRVATSKIELFLQ